MQTTFNDIVEDFISNKIGISANFLSIDLAKKLKGNLNDLLNHQKLKNAGIGNLVDFQNDKLIRNDSIYWLDRSHNNKFENEFLDLIDTFITFLNETCYTGITSYEFHYALFPIGSFYRKHIDQFKSDDSRQFSMIFYLNADWKIGDGGELNVFHESCTQSITPTNCKAVFFKSNELAHEVLETLVPRMSITGWLKRN